MKTFFKGLWIGGTMTVPGISGGTMAAVIGIYEELITAFVDIKENPKKYLPFLASFALGGLIGFVGLAGIVSKLLANPVSGMVLRIAFACIVLGSIPFLVKQSEVQQIKAGDIAGIFVGAAVIYGLSFLPEGIFQAGGGLGGVILQMAGGIIVAMALVLPGISVSHMLYILGLYEPVMEQVYTLQILSLVPLALGGVAGLIFTTRVMNQLLITHKQKMYMVIIGFVAASVVSMFIKN